MNHQSVWILLLVLVSVSVRQCQVDGLVWSLVLGNPVVDMTGGQEKDSTAVEPSSLSDDYDYESDEADDDVVVPSVPQHPRNTRPKLPPGSRPTRHHNHVSPRQSLFSVQFIKHQLLCSPQDKCLEDRQCGKGRFCDLHYGICRSEKSPGFACRRDRMCARGLACMFGRCQSKIPTGEEGQWNCYIVIFVVFSSY